MDIRIYITIKPNSLCIKSKNLKERVQTVEILKTRSEITILLSYSYFVFYIALITLHITPNTYLKHFTCIVNSSWNGFVRL